MNAAVQPGSLADPGVEQTSTPAFDENWSALSALLSSRVRAWRRGECLAELGVQLTAWSR